MKVVLAFDMGAAFVEELRAAFPDVEFCEAYEVEQQLAVVVGAQVQFGLISRPVFEAADALEWFHFVGIGFDSIVREIPEFRTGEVVMTNARQTHVVPMADHVLAAVLAYAHRLPEMLTDQQARRWDPERYLRRIVELEGTVMGILAMGDIGRAVAKRAAAFGVAVYGVDIVQMDPPEGVQAVWPVERLDEMLTIVDWLVVLAPRTVATDGMIDRRRLGLLKEGAHVTVVSRGGIVDETALAEGLRSGRIGGAALDATDVEPLPQESSLWDAPNLWLSPHVSAESVQLIERRQVIFKENLRRYLVGEALLNICDMEKGY